MVIRQRLHGIGISLNWAETGDVTFFLHTECRSEAMEILYTTNDFNLLDNEWHHLALAYGKETGVLFFIDGQLAFEQNNPLSNSPICHQAGGGYAIETDGGFGHMHFEGSIDDVRIYDRALTPQEVQYLFNGDG